MEKQSLILQVIEKAQESGLFIKDVQAKCNGDYINLRCINPEHEDNHPSAYIHQFNGNEYFKCKSCGCKGNLIEVTKIIFKLDSYREAVKKLVELDLLDANSETASRSRASEFLYDFYKFTNNLLTHDSYGKKIRMYLSKRGVEPACYSWLPIGCLPSKDTINEWAEEHDYPADLVEEYLSSKKENMLLFFYKGLDGSFISVKARDVLGRDDHKFYMLGSRKKSLETVAFTPSKDLVMCSDVIMVEGEFDVLVMASKLLSYRPDTDLTNTPIASFGTGSVMSNVSKALTDYKSNVVVFPDNDKAGLTYVTEVAQGNPYACIIMPKDYKPNADPAEYMLEHTWDDFINAYKNRKQGYEFISEKYIELYKGTDEKELQRKTRDEFLAFGSKLSWCDRADYANSFAELAGVPIESMLADMDAANKKEAEYYVSRVPATFGTYKPSKGDAPDEKLSDVVLSNLHSVYEDDGEEVSVKNGFTAEIYDQRVKKADIILDGNDFIDNKILNASITSELGGFASTNNRRVEDLREALKFISRGHAKDETIRAALGWDNTKDNFYFFNKVVDKDGVRDFTDIRQNTKAVPLFIKNYTLEQGIDTDENFKEAVKVLKEHIFKVYPYRITLPYFAFIMATVVYDFVPTVNPTMLILLGHTGFFKTSYSKVLVSLFGNFVDKNFTSWSSTAKSIPVLGYYAKNVPFVVDDLKPASVKSEDFVTLVQNYGDRQGRDKLTKNSQNMKLKYIRGNFIATGEDLVSIAEESSAARTLVLDIDRKGDIEHLDNAQEFARTKKLTAITARFIQYLINNKPDAQLSRQKIKELRKEFSATHARTNDVCAMLRFTWDLLKNIIPLDDLETEFTISLKALELKMSALSTEQTAGILFMDTLKELIAEGVLHILDYTKFKQPTMEELENGSPHNNVVGWASNREDGGPYVYIFPGLAYTNVQKRLQDTLGITIRNTKRALYDQLVNKGKLIPGNSAPLHKIRAPWDYTQNLTVMRFKKEDIIDFVEPLPPGILNIA